MAFRSSCLQCLKAGRIALPLVFLVSAGLGVHLVSQAGSHGAGLLDEAGTGSLAQTLAAPEEVNLPGPEADSVRPVPILVRAIEPSALYRPSLAEGSAAPASATSTAGVSARESLTYPVGVERFDQCWDACETRDPQLSPVVHYAPSAPMAEASAPLDMPILAEARDVIGRTVDSAVAGTSAAYGAVKQGLSDTLDMIR